MGVSTKETPPPSRISSEGGVEGVSMKEISPPSRVSSEGGVEWSGYVDRVPLRLPSRAREGWRMHRHDEEGCLFLRRVGSVEVSKLNQKKIVTGAPCTPASWC